MILLTGATGTVGRELVRQLGERTAPFRALVRSAAKASGIRQVGGEVAEGDLGQPDTLDSALKGVDKVFLLSGADLRQTSLQGNLVEAARRAKVRVFVKLSVMGADARSPVTLFRWHRQTEEQIERSGMAYTHLRPGSFMQNFLMAAGAIRGQGTLFEAAGDGKVAFIDARDIAACAATALTRSGFEGKALELTGVEALSYADVAQKLAQATGRAVRYQRVSLEEKRKAMLSAGMPDFLVKDLILLTELTAKGATAQIADGVERMLGRRPRTFDQFAQDFASAFG